MWEPVEADDEVPGMATAVERRMTELGLTPTTFAAASGLTYEGLLPVRKGVAKSYAAKTRQGVARALGWPHDWYQRLVAGEDPRSWTDAPGATEATVMARLDNLEAGQAEISGLVRELIAEVRAGRRSVARGAEGEPQP